MGVLKTKTPKTPYQMTLNFIDLGLGNWVKVIHYNGQTDLKVDSLSFLTLINKVQSHLVGNLRGLSFQDTHVQPFLFPIVTSPKWLNTHLALSQATVLSIGVEYSSHEIML